MPFSPYLPPKVKATKNSIVRFCVSVEVFKLLQGIDSKPLTGA